MNYHIQWTATAFWFVSFDFFLFWHTVLCISRPQITPPVAHTIFLYTDLCLPWLQSHVKTTNQKQESGITHTFCWNRLQYPMIARCRMLVPSDFMFKWPWLWDLILFVQTLSPLRNMCFIMQCSEALCSVQHNQSFKAFVLIISCNQQ